MKTEIRIYKGAHVSHCNRDILRKRTVMALSKLVLPVICAPMFIVSGLDLVKAACCEGIVGTFPALNARTTEALDRWLADVSSATCEGPQPVYGVNLIVHSSNPRLDADVDLCIKYKVPLIITSLGIRRDVINRIQSYGGLVFHDATTVRHAQKGIDAGVDGLILICAGGGGHAGSLSPFAFIPEVRRIFEGCIVAGGAISSGVSIAAARLLGADLTYIGTRLIATRESAASDGYKQMILDGAASDVVYTPAITGVHGSFLKASLRAAGLTPDDLPEKPASFHARRQDESTKQEGATAWKLIWSAGQGIGSIDDVPSLADLIVRMRGDFATAIQSAGSSHRLQDMIL